MNKNLEVKKKLSFQTIEKIEKILTSQKTPYEKKIALFKVIENLEVGEMKLEKKKRADYLLQAHLYADLAKQSMKDYKKITAETFSKTQ